MLKENKSIFDLCNISVWHNDNLGEGTTIVLLDENEVSFEYMKDFTEIPFPNKNETGHATTVSAICHQLAPKSKIIIMDFNRSGRELRTKMIDYIIEHKESIDVINVSLAFARESTLKEYFPRLEATGIPIICASGNESEEDKIPYPAKYPFTISIGAYNSSWKGTTSYSNGGKELDCIAPPDTSHPNSVGKIITQSGTSCSTPFVAGALALYSSWRRRNKLPKLTNEMARELIQINANDLYTDGHDYKSGYGLFKLPNEIPQIDKPIIVPPKESDKMFTDTKEHWAKDYINFVAEKGLMQGVGDNKFEPNKPMTRAEVATVIARMNGFVPKK